MNTIRWFLPLVFFQVSLAHAFKDQTAYVGLGYFSENVMGRITQSPTAAASTMGSTTYPLILKYDYQLAGGGFVSPMLTYTPLAREQAGGSAKISLLQFIIPYGGKIYESNWDWFIGGGLVGRTVKGSGGTVQLSNGTGTATFARPGRTVESRNFLLNFGTAYNYELHRFAFDVNVESPLAVERTYNLMFSYAYGFSSGSGGGG